jgi:hypothetical protein
MKYFLLSLSAIIFFTACQKTPKDTVSKENTLRSSKWKISSGTLTVKLPSGKDTSLSYLGLLPSCNQDDYLVFDSIYSGAVYGGSVKCSPSEPDYVRFTWQLLNNATVLSINNAVGLFYKEHMTINPPVADTVRPNPLIVDTLYNASYTVSPFDTAVINGALTNFTTNSFTISYSIPSTYLDTTEYHAYNPVLTSDTVNYSITYTSF